MKYYHLTSVAIVFYILLGTNFSAEPAFDLDRGDRYTEFVETEIKRVVSICNTLILNEDIPTAERLYWLRKVSKSDFAAIMLTASPQHAYGTLQLDTTSREGVFIVTEVWSQLSPTAWETSFDWATLGELPLEQPRYQEIFKTTPDSTNGPSRSDKAKRRFMDEIVFPASTLEELIRRDPKNAQESYERAVQSYVESTVKWLGDTDIQRLIDIAGHAIPEKQGIIENIIQTEVDRLAANKD